MFFKMDVILDTASDWLLVEGTACTNCNGNTYDIGPSLDDGQAILVSNPGETLERSYGTMNFVGKEYTDTVCVLFSACVENFEFFLIEYQSGLNEPMDGILGLSRDNPAYLDPSSGNQTGPLFIEKLWKDGIISDPIFAMHMDSKSGESWIDFGGFDLSTVAQGEELVQLEMIEKDFFWAQYCQAVAIGDRLQSNSYRWGPIDDFDLEIRDGSIYSIFDSGSTSLMISKLYYGSLINEIFARMGNITWKYTSDFRVVTECDADYPSLFFMFENNWIEVSPDNYVYHEQDDLMCTFLIMPVDSPTNMLGMPLLMDYYTVFDQKHDRIGWAPHKDSNKAPLTLGALPPQDQYLEAYTDAGVLPEQVHMPSMIMSWVFSILLFYGSYSYWNSQMKPTWKGMLSAIAYQITVLLLVIAMLVVVAFVMQPFLYTVVNDSFF